ncbi:pentatricopeptide repeat-containing protein At4g21300-like [Glycine soja]|uniref:Pentatricopeptide repeat-containing protein n=2 Tax=Glycine soja TaxID=3848 RepID=A0A445GVR1_GLYSO|nr:pentatricopeptide repeat-containing protein At4g21300-like [Glycine soja]XP_028202334.1 pentatricopeptide repeat-containing protein At4g21300-like [Glycine soja]XP_028202335.1 pentatricopeptide repeat-containing protein At4g21300-like [Glycine soja]RZB65336.1 Pentatricopeptide repeat-containing protein [Glycine soja]
MYNRTTNLCSIFRLAFSRSKLMHTAGTSICNNVMSKPETQDSLTTQLESLFRACSDASVVQQARQVHTQIIVGGMSDVCALSSRVLGLYVLCGRISDGGNLFFGLELCNALPWNWMIRGLYMLGWFDFALLFYFKMLGSNVSPDKYTFPYVIKACGGLNNVPLCMVVHNTARSLGFHVDLFVGSALIKLYADNGYICDARRVFDELPQRDTILWNVMLHGYVKSGDFNNAMGTFCGMRTSYSMVNSVTYTCILSICATRGKFCLGTQVHGLVIGSGFEFDPQVANTLVAMYSKCGNLFDARKLFNTMPQTDTVTWNGLIAGYVQNGFTDEAAPLFNAMISAGVKPDSVTFASFLPSILESGSLRHCKEVHSYIVRHRVPFDVYLKSALIDIYFKGGDVEMARKIFQQNTLVDVAVCTAMISGYVLHGLNIDAINTFRWLIQEGMVPNSLTMASVLPACAALAALKLGKELHCDILKKQLENIVNVGSAITDMYAKCGRLDLAYEFFRRMSETDSICWNSMISSFSQNGKPEMAVDLFRQMGMSGAKFDSVSLSSALSSAANLPALYYGKEMHGYVIRNAFSSDTFVASALIDMYSKCGKLALARCVFNLMAGKNEVSWNSIIAAYGNHGCARECLDLFHEMLRAGVHPDHVTFLVIISACGHAGLVGEGIHYFHCMTREYGIGARMEHYACMVDLYGRAGRLHEAFDAIKSMPFTPDAGVWGTFLGACRLHGNVELAKLASRHLLELDPKNSGYYVLLSNVHADAGEWGSVLKVRRLMKEKGVQKIPGYSWIDVNGGTHMFSAAEGNHPESVEIYLILNSLLLELRKQGYVPQPYLPLHPQITGNN